MKIKTCQERCEDYYNNTNDESVAPRQQYMQDEIEDLRKAYSNLLIECDTLRHGYLKASDRCVELEDCLQDAKRYRWLRDNARSVDWGCTWADGSWSNFCRYDAAYMNLTIDAHMENK
jgi:hypothetical protein